MALKQQHEDFEPVLHPAVTHTELEWVEDPVYYGSHYEARTVTDHPDWIELRPVGRRITEIPLEALEATRLETLLAHRSWLWQFHADRAGRERALEQIAPVRVSLPTILDRLPRHGALEPTASLMSAYLIGSYPWVDTPADIDLFLVVNGERNVNVTLSR